MTRVLMKREEIQPDREGGVKTQGDGRLGTGQRAEGRVYKPRTPGVAGTA